MYFNANSRRPILLGRFPKKNLKVLKALLISTELESSLFLYLDISTTISIYRLILFNLLPFDEVLIPVKDFACLINSKPIVFFGYSYSNLLN